MNPAVDQATLARLFTEARSHNAWQPQPIADALLEQLYALTAMGPTAANSSPARFVFVRSAEGKERLKPCLSEGNQQKTMDAPVTVIVAYDSEFYEELPYLFPHTDARSWFAGDTAMAEASALRNSSMQAAYLLLAARALGLDTGPMSGFDAQKLDQAFFQGTPWKANLLINLGHGDPAALRERLPRLPFEKACVLA